jgi:hypothetical protein
VLLNLPRRIVATACMDPDEYDATVLFEGWEREDGSDESGWDVEINDYHRGVTVLLRYSDPDGTVTTRTLPLPRRKESQ